MNWFTLYFSKAKNQVKQKQLLTAKKSSLFWWGVGQQQWTIFDRYKFTYFISAFHSAAVQVRDKANPSKNNGDRLEISQHRGPPKPNLAPNVTATLAAKGLPVS